MKVKVRFPVDFDRAHHVGALVRAHAPGADPISVRFRHHLIYLVDRRHLVRFGRPVVGGAYTAMADGPMAKRAVAHGEPPPDFKLNLDYLSVSDQETIGEILNRYARYTPAALELAVKDSAWRATQLGREMDLAICWTDEPGADQHVLEFLRATQPSRDVVYRLGRGEDF